MYPTPEQYAQLLGFAAAQEMCRSIGNVTQQLAEGELFAKSNGTERPLMVNPLSVISISAMLEIAGKVPLGVAKNKEIQQPMASLKQEMQLVVADVMQQFGPVDLSSTTAAAKESEQVMVDVKPEVDHQPMRSKEQRRQQMSQLSHEDVETIDISDDEDIK